MQDLEDLRNTYKNIFREIYTENPNKKYIYTQLREYCSILMDNLYEELARVLNEKDFKNLLKNSKKRNLLLSECIIPRKKLKTICIGEKTDLCRENIYSFIFVIRGCLAHLKSSKTYLKLEIGKSPKRPIECTLLINNLKNFEYLYYGKINIRVDFCELLDKMWEVANIIRKLIATCNPYFYQFFDSDIKFLTAYIPEKNNMVINKIKFRCNRVKKEPKESYIVLFVDTEKEKITDPKSQIYNWGSQLYMNLLEKYPKKNIKISLVDSTEHYHCTTMSIPTNENKLCLCLNLEKYLDFSYHDGNNYKSIYFFAASQ